MRSRIGPLHDDEGGREVRRRRHAVKVEGRIARRLDRREHDRQVLGPAARHHRVDRDLLHRGAAVVGRDLAHELRALAGGAREHPLHALARTAGTTGRPSVTPLSNQISNSSMSVAAGAGHGATLSRQPTPSLGIEARVLTLTSSQIVEKIEAGWPDPAVEGGL